MDNKTDPGRSWWKWAITPPQSYAVYLGALVLVYLLSFYAGTLKPKGSTGLGPPPASVPAAPRN
jgi:ABC-type Fe3+ transport system permease subunit